MRRNVGLVLLVVGALFLVLAPLLRWYAYPRLAVAPQDQASTTVSSGTDVTVFSIPALLAGEDPEVVTDVTSTRGTVSVVEDLPEGTSTDDVAVWETVVDTTNADGDTLTATRSIVAFDRRTGAGVEGYGQSIDGDPIDHEGQILKFPFGTEQRDYEFWDIALREATPAVFDGEDEIDGMTVYRFVQTIEPTVVSQLEVPGSLAGSDAPSIEADRTYANTRTLWVEPETGVIIRGQEEQDTVLVYQGDEVATITSGTIRYTDEQVQANVDEYRPLASQLNLVGTVLPLVLGVLGVIGLIAGVLLLRTPYTPRRAAERVPHDDVDEAEDTVVDEKPPILDFGAERQSP
jgi:Porin PorA